jgi:hypothetical protein
MIKISFMAHLLLLLYWCRKYCPVASWSGNEGCLLGQQQQQQEWRAA